MNAHTDKAARATSFGTAAQDYDRYRVGLPEEVAETFLPHGVEAVLDLGAGTGAMTRRLVGRARRVYAVDPDPRMTRVLAENCPQASVHEGTGEHIPLPDASVDAVVAASSWHWMDPAATVPEVARVLRSSGTLCIVWNRRDRSVPWVADLEALRNEVSGGDDFVEGRVRHYLSEPWLPDAAPFRDIEILELPWKAAMTPEELARLLTTFHAFIAAPEEAKPEMLRKFEEHVAGDSRIPAGPDGLVRLPMVCHVWRATRT